MRRHNLISTASAAALAFLLLHSCTFDRGALSEKFGCDSDSDCPTGEACLSGFCGSALIPTDVVEDTTIDLTSPDGHSETGRVDMGPDVGPDADSDADDDATAEDGRAEDGLSEDALAEDGIIEDGPSEDPMADSDATDTADLADATDVADAVDVGDTADVTDTVDVGDTADVTDAADVTDTADVGDTADVTDTADVGDAPDIDDVADAPDLSCPVEERNACGGCTTLDDLWDTPCGDGCGGGFWACADSEHLFCDSDGEANLCGGCGDLDGVPDEDCGDCGSWECADQGLRCVDPGLNECDGCGDLDGAKDDECGACGQLVCEDDGSALRCEDPGTNACGTCGPLGGEPGDRDAECGACGFLRCSEDGLRLVCDDPGLNDCFGCGTLEGQPGTRCQDCGVWACADDDASVYCADDGFNSCGTCGELDGEPGERGDECGECGELVCAREDTALRCQDDGFNGCDTCADFGDRQVGGPCEDGCGVWECSDDGLTLECDLIHENECGGCGPLPGEEGGPCSCDGHGDAEWICRDNGEMGCADPAEPVLLHDEADDRTIVGPETFWVDEVGDYDPYLIAVTTDHGRGGDHTIEPSVTLTPTAWDAGSFEVCVFWVRHDFDSGVSERDLDGYSCGSGDECTWFDVSAGQFHKGEEVCKAEQVGFDTGQDVYGCCDGSGLGSTLWQASMYDIDIDRRKDTGYVVPIIISTGVAACFPYNLQVFL